MKKSAILALILLFFIAIYIYNRGAKPATNFAASTAKVLGSTTDATQPFKAAGAKVGYHVYYPTFLPNGYSLNGVNVNTFNNGEIDYAIVSPSDASQLFIIAERPASMDIGQSKLMLDPSALTAAQWKISNVAVSGEPGTLGQAPAGSGSPQGHEDLTYSTKDGVAVEIFDSFGSGQLVQIAQSMQ